MTRDEMMHLVMRHLRAEGAGDVAGAVAVYTDDIEHDAVGFPGSPRRGKEAAAAFYQGLVANFRGTGEDITRMFVSDNAITMDSIVTGRVTGSMMGMPGDGREVSFRMLHVFEFRDGLISRENVWVDGSGVAAQLAPPADPAP